MPNLTRLVRLRPVAGALALNADIASLKPEVWAALGSERAYIAVKLTSTIQSRLALAHGVPASEPLSVGFGKTSLVGPY